jgi:glucosamine--fructose-6-phosphate aminotransferase (isomerizing)
MSQSGETADVRESVKKVQQKWCHTFGIVNTAGSTISRMCDMWMHTHAWAEIGVASTKNVIAQLSVLLIMALDFGGKRNLQSSTARDIIDHFWKLPEIITKMLNDQTQIEKIIEKYHTYNDFFYLGRWLLQWTAHESSLKLKELSYLHSESYPTGELKHGPLALVWPEFPCVVIGTTNFLYEKTISNVKEIKARKAPVIGYIYENSKYSEVYDDVVFIPETHDVLAPITSLIPTWLFAVWVAKKLWKDIDKPQNLAKSVTVE